MCFVNARNGASLTNIIDVAAHRIFFRKMNNLKILTYLYLIDISIAEPIDVQIDELGNDNIQMYQLIGIISDEKVGGLESLLNYTDENSFSKDDPAINENHYHIT